MNEFSSDKVIEIFNNFDCAIGLDVSRRSTGLVILDSCRLEKYQIITDARYSKSDAFWEAKMKAEFKGYLTEILKDRVFDVAVVENTINGINAITNKELILLNSIFDDLVLEGVCDVKKNGMYRPNSSSWRKELSKLYEVGACDNKKEYTEQILLGLGYRYAEENKDSSKSAKAKMGYYDILDATGMMLGHLNKIYEGKNKIVNTT